MLVFRPAKGIEASTLRLQSSQRLPENSMPWQPWHFALQSSKEVADTTSGPNSVVNHKPGAV